ncbi:hypothetical protein T310_4737 [Rasamsonia emersonii CBS 393.64]|uniref:Uncharacterized protein n=1 Tax=Rasamsonia emersonii (strain ATCC 16479 / CBS 393.64 / IMI 116815) TaxID=1408163 RepID=A0A0F4YTR9_RASE3|nr:hypothetical protein T310_4737 [Rasamsonia emersonii CBS 393.64]KKA21231.1 hypothetical protein T310_4737 [Rasamsonia emersonii CBS 393.64]
MVVVSFLGIAQILSKSTRYDLRRPELDPHDRLKRVVHRAKRKPRGSVCSRDYEMSDLQKSGTITVTRSLEALAVTRAQSKSRLVRLLSAYPFVVCLAEHSHQVDILNLALTCKEAYRKVLGFTRNDHQYIVQRTCPGYTTSCFGCGIKVCQACWVTLHAGNRRYWHIKHPSGSVFVSRRKTPLGGLLLDAYAPSAGLRSLAYGGGVASRAGRNVMIRAICFLLSPECQSDRVAVFCCSRPSYEFATLDLLTVMRFSV